MQNYFVYLKNEGVQTSVPNTASKTTLDFLYYDGETYRNEFWASEIGNGHQTVLDGAQTSGGSPASFPLNGAQTLSEDVFFKQNDAYNAVPPWFKQKRKTRLYLWGAGSGTPTLLAAVAVFGGAAVVNLTSVALTKGSATLGCASNAGVKIGSLLSGTGIPANTYVASIPGGGTSLIMSQAANATVVNTQPSAVATSDPTYVLQCTSTTGVLVGQKIVGQNIVDGTTVAFVASDGVSLGLSQPTLASSSGGSAMTNGTGDVLFEEWLDNCILSIGSFTEV